MQQCHISLLVAKMAVFSNAQQLTHALQSFDISVLIYKGHAKVW
jgi:hypothetical protein